MQGVFKQVEVHGVLTYKREGGLMPAYRGIEESAYLREGGLMLA